MSSVDTIGTAEGFGFGSGKCYKCDGSFQTCSIKVSTAINKCLPGRTVGITTCGSCIFND